MNRKILFQTIVENLPSEGRGPICASGNRILCYKKSDFDAFCTVCNALGLDTIGGVIGVGKDGVEEDTWFFIALREESKQESRSCNDSQSDHERRCTVSDRAVTATRISCHPPVRFVVSDTQKIASIRKILAVRHPAT